MFEQVFNAILAITMGVGGMLLYYFGTNAILERTGDEFKQRVRPWLFVIPALAVLGAFLIFPALNTLYLSFTDDNPRTDVEIRMPAQFEDNIRQEIEVRRNGTVNEIQPDGDFIIVDGVIREQQIVTVNEFIRELGADSPVVYFTYVDGEANVRYSPELEEALQGVIADLGVEFPQPTPREDLLNVVVAIDDDQVDTLAGGIETIGGEDTLAASLSAGGQQFFVLDNYEWAFTDPEMLESFGNNILWLILVPTLSTAIGLIIAVLADRVKWESLAKALIFLPMAISFVGASVIWRFIYFYRAPGEEQIGLLNAAVTGIGAEPVAWLTVNPVNNIALIVILIWIQTGFAMVLLSAALKAVPDETIEAARIDGASEPRIFFNIIIPQITSTIAVVMTTIIILVLKVFDIPYVMTSGEFGTQVLANVMYEQMFGVGDFPRGSVVAIILMVAVLPVMYINIRRFRREEAFR